MLTKKPPELDNIFSDDVWNDIVKAYHNTDPNWVFHDTKGEIYITSIGYTISPFRHKAKPFTGVWNNGITITWIVNGIRHRSDGPALIWCGQDHDPTSVLYYLNGVEMSAKEFKRQYFITHLKEYEGV